MTSTPIKSLDVEAAILADLIQNADSFSILTGAGMSTASGLPDFRSKDGLWEKYDPMVAGSIQTFRKDPALVWSFYYDRLTMANPQPNAGHEAVARLSKLPNYRGLITQNVDGLHEHAGTENVITVHGSLDYAICVGRGHRVSMDDAIKDRATRDDNVPRCPQCNSRLKPGIVLFGEQLDQDRMSAAKKLAKTSKLFLCLGTSLQVYPVAALPESAMMAGRQVAIITQGETPFDDRPRMLTMRSYAALHEILPAAADLIA